MKCYLIQKSKHKAKHKASTKDKKIIQKYIDQYIALSLAVGHKKALEILKANGRKESDVSEC